VPQVAYPLRRELRPVAPASRRWVVTPLCISLLLHLVGLTAVDRIGWLEVGEAERPVKRALTVEAGTVSAESLERVAMVPELSEADLLSMRSAPELSADLFPQYRDSGPREDVPEMKALPRYPEEELPLVSRTKLSGRSQAFVRNGELEVIEPGKEQVTYIPAGRLVEPLPPVQAGATPRLRDHPGGLVSAIPGTGTRLLDAGTAPRLSLKPPPMNGVSVPALTTVAVDRDAEGMFADDGRPVPLKPLPLDVKIDVYAEPGSTFRFFRMTIQQRRGLKLPVIAKNVLFVVDISSSIRLRMLNKVRVAVANAAAGLNRGDRLNVIRFSEQSYKAFDSFVPATPANIAKAARSIHREPGQIRTDVYTALKNVIANLPAKGEEALRPTNIFLVTDGNPTVGMRDIRHIVNDLTRVTRTNYSIFAINPGAATANSYLLELLAYRNRGVFVKARSPDAADAALLGLLMQFKDPVLMNLRAQYGNFKVDQVYPQTPPNLYAGRPIVIYGRCEPGDTIAVRIIGDSTKDRRKFLYTRTLPEVLAADRSIAREWARGKIHYLTSRIARLGEKRELLDEIRRLSKRYKLASPYE